jgi:hypothetical protein
MDPIRPCGGLLERMLRARPVADVADVASRLDSPGWQVVFMEKIGVECFRRQPPRKFLAEESPQGGEVEI